MVLHLGMGLEAGSMYFRYRVRGEQRCQDEII